MPVNGEPSRRAGAAAALGGMTRLLEVLSQVKMTNAELTGLVFQLDAWRSQMLSFMRDYDLVLCPPCARAETRAS